MAETALIRVDDQLFEWTRYTRGEIQALWARETNQARYTGTHPKTTPLRYHLYIPREDQALEMSALWLRRLCADPDSVCWEPPFLRFWLGTCADPSTTQTELEKLHTAYFLVGADERGPLFADEGDRVVDVRVLLDGVQAMAQMPDEIGKKAREVLADAYGRSKP